MFTVEVKNISINQTADSMQAQNLERLMQLIPVPIFCVLGLITNALNIAVFLHPKMKDVSFKYMLIISISNLVYSVLMSPIMFLFCNGCSLNQTYAAQYIRIINYYFLSFFLQYFISFCELLASFHRYLILRNSSIGHKFPHKLVVSILFLFSILIHLNELFGNKIVQTNYHLNGSFVNTVYTTERGVFGLSTIGKIIPSIQATLKTIISTGLLTAINIGIVYEFSKKIKKRRTLNSRPTISKDNF